MAVSRYSLAAAGATLLLSAAPAAAVPVHADVVMIDADAAGEELAEDVCDEIGRSVTVGQGLWGLGLFDRHECVAAGDEHVTGERWQIRISASAAGTTVELVGTYGGAVMARTEVRLPTPPRGLMREGLARVVGARLLDGLPMLGKIPAERVDADGRSLVIRDPSPQRALPPPPALLVYQLEYSASAQLWLPRQTTRARRSPEDPARWALEDEAARLPRKEGPAALFVHGVRGPGSFGASLDKEIARFTAAQPASSPKIGSDDHLLHRLDARYGIGVTRSEIFEGSTSATLELRLRRGLFAGLRLELNVWPRIDDSVEGRAAEVAAHRAAIGWAWEVEWRALGARLVLGPTAGVWTAKASIEVEEPAGERAVFRLKDAPCVGVYASAELQPRGRLGARLWVAGDSGLAVVGQDRGTSILASRSGGEAAYAVTARLAAVGFAELEYSRLAKDPGAEHEDAAVTKITNAVVRLGVGLRTEI